MLFQSLWRHHLEIELKLDSDKKEKADYFWLKLYKDFFDRDDVRIVDNMGNGKEMLLLYLKLLSKSLGFNGKLMINKVLPYNNELIASSTNTKIDVVRTAMELYERLGWIELLPNGVVFMKELADMTGHETKAAKVKRLQRGKEDKKKLY